MNQFPNLTGSHIKLWTLLRIYVYVIYVYIQAFLRRTNIFAINIFRRPSEIDTKSNVCKQTIQPNKTSLVFKISSTSQNHVFMRDRF